MARSVRSDSSSITGENDSPFVYTGSLVISTRDEMGLVLHEGAVLEFSVKDPSDAEYCACPDTRGTNS